MTTTTTAVLIFALVLTIANAARLWSESRRESVRRARRRRDRAIRRRRLRTLRSRFGSGVKL